MKARVLITSQIASGSGFGIVVDGAHSGEAVFIPGKTMVASQTTPQMTVQAELVPNRPDQRDECPWMAPFVLSDDGQDVDVDAVRASLSAFEYPVSAEDAGVSLASLYAAYGQGAVVRVTAQISPTSKPVVMWAASMEVV